MKRALAEERKQEASDKADKPGKSDKVGAR